MAVSSPIVLRSPESTRERPASDQLPNDNRRNKGRGTDRVGRVVGQLNGWLPHYKSGTFIIHLNGNSNKFIYQKTIILIVKMNDALLAQYLVL